ncbi:MAG: cupredoxin domain-containing protein [Candidatus Mariimomonas ferrooxydans]
MKIKKTKSDYIIYVIIAGVILFSVLNISFIMTRNYIIEEAIRNYEIENEPEPAKLQVIKISASSCAECFNIDPVLEALRNNDNINITSEETLELSSTEAMQLIERYGIEKLSTVLVLGEINKSEVIGMWNDDWKVVMENDRMLSAFFVGLLPPYYDLKDSSIVGMVSLKHIMDNSCEQCSDLSQVINFFKQNGVKFSDEESMEYTSQQAAEVISEFSIRRVPAIIVSKDILEYPSVAQVWNQLNASEKEGFYAIPSIIPPYRNLETNDIEGLVDITYLTDNSCEDCYNVSIYRQSLVQFGAVIDNEDYVDITSDNGNILMERYNITKVPTIILSPDAGMHRNLVQAWSVMGDIADDGSFVMRNHTAPGKYRDLFLNQSVNNIYVLSGEFEYRPSSIDIEEGDLARIIFINAGNTGHNFVIDELNIETNILQSGQSEIVEFLASETGVFSFYCSVEGHREAGMEGVLTVS